MSFWWEFSGREHGCIIGQPGSTPPKYLGTQSIYPARLTCTNLTDLYRGELSFYRTPSQRQCHAFETEGFDAGISAKRTAG